MNYLCCPRCHGSLDTGENEHSSCTRCDAEFPLYEGHLNFVSSELDDFSRWQRDVYDGKMESLLSPGYAEPEGAHSHNDHCMEVARLTGLIMPNWKGMKSREVMDRLDAREGELVLDVGCGLGILLNNMNVVYGTRGVGIDFSHVGLKAAISHNPCANDYHVADALNLPFFDNSFDIAVSFDVIEHVSDPALFVKEMARVVKPGGRLLIYTPSRRDTWTWHWWERLILRGRYNLGIDNLAGHDPEHFLEPGQLASYLRGAGLHDIETVPFHTLYTLIFDEVYPMFIYRFLGRPAMLKAVFKALELADAPAGDRGYSNGFFAYGWKG